MQGNKMENLNLNNKSVNVYLESGNIPVYLFQVIHNRYYYILEALKPLLIGLIFNRMALTLSYDTLSTFQQ